MLPNRAKNGGVEPTACLVELEPGGAPNWMPEGWSGCFCSGAQCGQQPLLAGSQVV